MDATRAIQIAVARADVILCQIAALPWGFIGLSLLLTAIVFHIIRKAVQDRWSG